MNQFTNLNTSQLSVTPDPNKSIQNIKKNIHSIKTTFTGFEQALQLQSVDGVVREIDQLPDTIKNTVVSQLDQLGDFAENNFNALLSHIQARTSDSSAIRLGTELTKFTKAADSVLQNIDEFVSHELNPKSTYKSDISALITKLHQTSTALSNAHSDLLPMSQLDTIQEAVTTVFETIPDKITAMLEAHIPIPFDTINNYLDNILNEYSHTSEKSLLTSDASSRAFIPDYLRMCATLLSYLSSVCSEFNDTFSKKVSAGILFKIGGDLGVNVGWAAAAAILLGDKAGITEAIEVEVEAIDILAPIPMLLATFFDLTQLGMTAAADWIDIEQIV